MCLGLVSLSLALWCGAGIVRLRKVARTCDLLLAGQMSYWATELSGHTEYGKLVLWHKCLPLAWLVFCVHIILVSFVLLLWVNIFWLGMFFALFLGTLTMCLFKINVFQACYVVRRVWNPWFGRLVSFPFDQIHTVQSATEHSVHSKVYFRSGVL